MLLGKGEILEHMKSEMPFELSERTIPYIKEAMDLYANKIILDEIKRRHSIILSEPNGIVRETMIQNLLDGI
jgi:hypothetical protein